MNNFKANIKQKYNISNYQAEQIIFVIKSLGSELSKMLIMGILFRNEILLFLFQLIFMCFLRSFQEVSISILIGVAYLLLYYI